MKQVALLPLGLTKSLMLVSADFHMWQATPTTVQVLKTPPRSKSLLTL